MYFFNRASSFFAHSFIILCLEVGTYWNLKIFLGYEGKLFLNLDKWCLGVIESVQ
jgi:hypothetical protein